MLRAVGGLIAGIVFATGFFVTLEMDGSLHYPLGYPQVLLAVLALLFLASGARDWRAAHAGETVASTPPAAPDAGGPVVLWMTIALCIAYAVSWTLIGFFPSTFLYVAAQLWLLRRRHWGFLLGAPAAVTLLVYVVFDRLLALPFPGGSWFGG